MIRGKYYYHFCQLVRKGGKKTFMSLYSDAYVGLGIVKFSDHDKEKNFWFTEKLLKMHYRCK